MESVTQLQPDALDEPDANHLPHPFHHTTHVEYAKYDGLFWSFFPPGTPPFTPDLANILPAEFEVIL
jgi:hypothetical protein